MQELKLITVKSVEDSKAKKYFVQADSMTEADAIITEELQCDYKVNPYTPKVYEDIIRLYDVESNPDEEELLYFECVLEVTTLEDKVVKETYLLLSEDIESILDYVAQDESELNKLIKLNIEGILRAEVSATELAILKTKMDN